jgi:hypothetical protein
MNLEVLQGSFTVAPKPGLDSLDPRWSELSGMVQEGQFAEAAQMAEQLLAQGVYDVRIVGYLCFGHFLDEGPASLAPISVALASVLNVNWEAFGPAASRAKMAQQSLTWLFKQVQQQIEFQENFKGDGWDAWLATTPEQLDEALTHLFELQQALSPRLEKGAQAVLEPLGKVEAWLRAFKPALSPAAPPADEEPARRPADAPTDKPAATATATATPTATSPALVDGGSPHLAQLLRKMEAFAKLVERGKFAPAVIVAADVHAILAQFDPLLYFPKLFSRFARLSAVHARQLADAQIDLEAPPWKALRALYQVDLDEFLALD